MSEKQATDFNCKSCNCVVPVIAVTCGDCVAERLSASDPDSPVMEPVPDILASSDRTPRQQHDYLLQFFAYDHLPPNLSMVSKPFCELAHAMVLGDNTQESGTCTFGGPLPSNPERTVALRKLLEAKDCAVRALIFKNEAELGV